MTNLVTDLPIWTDCPYQCPKALEIRKGRRIPDEPELVVLWDPKTRRHVDLEVETLTAEQFEVAGNMLLGKGM